jgi:hypothetical protein
MAVPRKLEEKIKESLYLKLSPIKILTALFFYDNI